MNKINEPKKKLPNNKQELLSHDNYEMYNLDLLRKVFPRIIDDYNSSVGRTQRKFQIRDVIALYFYLLSYVDGTYILKMEMKTIVLVQAFQEDKR